MVPIHTKRNTTFFMNPDFVRDPLHMLFSGTGTKCNYHPDLTPESEMESIFPHYDLTLGLRCNIASTQSPICFDVVPLGRLSCNVFYVDVVARHCCKVAVLLTFWQWWATLNELPASRPSEQQSQPAPRPWPAGPWAYISSATAHITNTTTTMMWQLNPSPTSPTYRLNKLEPHWN